jgi:hypothetical protein
MCADPPSSNTTPAVQEPERMSLIIEASSTQSHHLPPPWPSDRHLLGARLDTTSTVGRSLDREGDRHAPGASNGSAITRAASEMLLRAEPTKSSASAAGPHFAATGSPSCYAEGKAFRSLKATEYGCKRPLQIAFYAN